MSGENTITLTRRHEPTGNGDWVFRREGVKASVYINKRIFARHILPETITLTSKTEAFRLPGNLDPEATTKRIDLLEERAAKKREQGQRVLSDADALHTEADELQTALANALDQLGQ